MRVIGHRSIDHLHFKQLSAGEVFVHEDRPYMRIAVPDGEGSLKVNAVCMITGYVEKIAADAVVERRNDAICTMEND